MDAIFLAIAAYLLYRFLTGFLIPVFRTTRQVRRQFGQMNGDSRSEQSANPDPHTRNTHSERPRPNTSKVGEYIDFEEIK